MRIHMGRWALAALVMSASVARGQGQAEGAVVATPADSDQFTIRSLENVWAIAITQQDSSALVPIFGPEYVAVTTGVAHHQTRAEALHEIAHPADSTHRVTRISFDSLTVHVVSRDRAIAHGAVSESGNGPGGEFADQLVFVDTFVRRKGRWVCVASRFTVLPAHKT